MFADILVQHTTLTLTSPRQEARGARSGQSAGHAKPRLFIFFTYLTSSHKLYI